MHILFDIGGTKTRITALKKGANTFSIPRVIETPYLPEDIAAAMAQYAKEIDAAEPIEGVVGGIAGALDKSNETLVYSPNIMRWVGKNIAATFKKGVGAPVTLMNDALLAAVGEARVGGGKGFEVVVYITVGTGVGGARVVNGMPDHGVVGFEVGHQIVDLDGSLCPDCDKLFPGRKGELETMVGGAALRAQTNTAPKELTDKGVWSDLAEKLAAGVYNSILHWTPDAVVFGGSMILGDPAIPVDLIETKIKKRARPITVFPVFKKGELKDFGVLHGAMAMVQK